MPPWPPHKQMTPFLTLFMIRGVGPPIARVLLGEWPWPKEGGMGRTRACVTPKAAGLPTGNQSLDQRHHPPKASPRSQLSPHPAREEVEGGDRGETDHTPAPRPQLAQWGQAGALDSTRV